MYYDKMWENLEAFKAGEPVEKLASNTGFMGIVRHGISEAKHMWKGTAKGGFNGVKERMGKHWESYSNHFMNGKGTREMAKDTANAVKDTANAATNTAKNTANDTFKTVKKQFKKHPIRTGAMAAGAGVAAGAAFSGGGSHSSSDSPYNSGGGRKVVINNN